MVQKKAALECSKCGTRNYTVTVKPTRVNRLELRKFCKRCGANTLHKETK